MKSSITAHAGAGEGPPGLPFRGGPHINLQRNVAKSSGLKTPLKPEWSDAARDEPALDLARPRASRARGGGAACAHSSSRSPARLHGRGRDTGVAARAGEASARRSPTDRVLDYTGSAV